MTPGKHIMFFAIACIAISIPGCKKDEPISTTPNIKFVSMTPNPAVKYQDEINITVEYTDGDGDLGDSTADVKNVFITDGRNNVTYQYRLPMQAPAGSNIIIKGDPVFVLPPQGFIDDNNTSETTTYSIYMVDRAGHQSNTISTSELTINSQ